MALTSPDRLLWPETGITKANLAAYLARVADRILPHIASRPLTLVRCPGGQGKPCFVQRHPGKGLPEALKGAEVPGVEGPLFAIEDEAGLEALAQVGALEVHPWGSRLDRPDRPERMVIDLDPGPGLGWSDLVEAARAVRARLEAAGLSARLLSTGGKGLHVIVPLERRHDWDTVKDLSEALAEAMSREAPDRFLATNSKEAREGRIFIDWLRNAREASAVAPWSPRARKGAPVAVPLDWSELGPEPVKVSLREAADRPDPWATDGIQPQRITAAVRQALA